MPKKDASHGADPSLVLGQVAALLADRSAVPLALDALVAGLGLRTAILRSPAGATLGGTPATQGDPTVELPVHGCSGMLLATLTVSGAGPGDLPALRSAAAVLGLALRAPEDDIEFALEDDRDELADALHDGPVQSLVVARYASDAAVRGGDVVFARDAVQAALVDVRRFLWHLRPRGSAGLVEAIDQLSTHLVEAGGTTIGLLGDVAAASALRGAGGVAAYRLVQAVAQPDAPPVRVTIRAEGSRLRVDVDGGAPLVRPERWLQRAQSLGGELHTSAGRIRLVLPKPFPKEDARTEA